MRANKNWTAEEIEYLSEHFGQSCRNQRKRNYLKKQMILKK